MHPWLGLELSQIVHAPPLKNLNPWIEPKKMEFLRPCYESILLWEGWFVFLLFLHFIGVLIHFWFDFWSILENIKWMRLESKAGLESFIHRLCCWILTDWMKLVLLQYIDTIFRDRAMAVAAFIFLLCISPVRPTAQRPLDNSWCCIRLFSSRYSRAQMDISLSRLPVQWPEIHRIQQLNVFSIL